MHERTDNHTQQENTNRDTKNMCQNHATKNATKNATKISQKQTVYRTQSLVTPTPTKPLSPKNPFQASASWALVTAFGHVVDVGNSSAVSRNALVLAISDFLRQRRRLSFSIGACISVRGRCGTKRRRAHTFNVFNQISQKESYLYVLQLLDADGPTHRSRNATRVLREHRKPPVTPRTNVFDNVRGTTGNPAP